MPPTRNEFNEQVMHELGSISAELKNIKEATDGLKIQISNDVEAHSREVEKRIKEIHEQNKVLTSRITALESLRQHLIGAAAGVGVIVSLIVGVGKYLVEHLWVK